MGKPGHASVAAEKLADRIKIAIDLYSPDLLFIHRDAESQGFDARKTEIEQAVNALQVSPHVCVIPVRMTEAWLLIDEQALRQAAGNPNGSVSLQLPSVSELERIPDPKATLHNLLKQASALSGRRLKGFSAHRQTSRLADLIDDFSPLRQLPAFQELGKTICSQMQRL